jgi:predicted O-linked N-acetylglucosamine transferase (SPINDLY family)
MSLERIHEAPPSHPPRAQTRRRHDDQCRRRLDTWPYNSGTTASDALRAGVPLLTLKGDTFAGRMAASLLHSLGLDQLIAQDHAAYIDLAIALAADRPRLQALRTVLAARLPDSPLFDPQRFAHDLERLFEAMLAQRARGASGVVRA